MTLDEKLAKVLPFKSKLPGQFQCFHTIDEIMEMLKKFQFPKISTKIKNCKNFRGPNSKPA